MTIHKKLVQGLACCLWVPNETCNIEGPRPLPLPLKNQFRLVLRISQAFVGNVRHESRLHWRELLKISKITKVESDLLKTTAPVIRNPLPPTPSAITG